MHRTENLWNRRDGFRFPIRVPIVIRATRTTPRSDGLTRNVSSGGVLYFSSSRPEIGARIFFDIHLWSDSGYEIWLLANGRVLRAEISDTTPDAKRWPFEVASTLTKSEIMRLAASVSHTAAGSGIPPTTR